MSAHLSWMIIRNNNAFLVKKRNIKKPFSKESSNLTNLSSFRYSGIIHAKTIGIEGGKTADKKSFTLIRKKAKAHRKPASAPIRTEFKSGPRRSLHKMKRLLKNNRYRRDLTKAALRKASAVLRAQRPLPTKKPRAKKAE